MLKLETYQAKLEEHILWVEKQKDIAQKEGNLLSDRYWGGISDGLRWAHSEASRLDASG